MMSRNGIAGVAGFALLVVTSAAQAGIHTWDVGEVFSNADGTIQFVEFVEAGGGNFETGISGGSTSSTAGSKSFTWSGPAVINTAFKRYLVGSQSFANLTGAPPVDAIMPLSYLGNPILPFYFQPASDTVSFGPYDSCVFTGVPTNGVGSRNCESNTNQVTNSPTNYAGASAPVVAAIAPGLLDNFQNGTLQNWLGVSATNQASGGPGGASDRYLQITTPGSPLFAVNEFQWAGNAVAAGADRVVVDLNNSGGTPLSLRLVVMNPGCESGGSACTAWTSIGALVLPAASGWAHVSFSLKEADLVRVMGSDSYAATFANVERVMIRYDDGPPDPPIFDVIAAGTLGIDNVELPEPTGLSGLVAGAGLLAALARRGSGRRTRV